MCGILGSFGNISNISSNLFQQALDTLVHRGPDAEGVWHQESVYLGHRRLAILDLTDAGIQPMVDEKSGLVIVFNGEIYNYLELRTELIAKGHSFKTKTDTEVLLKGYLEWGKEVLTKCNGMWALAIWDPKKYQLFLARDRFGVKPLYFSLQSQGLLFASEPKALHTLDKSLTEANPNAIIDFIVDSKMHVGTHTFYKSIKSLPSAHYAIYDAKNHNFKMQRYWDYPAPASQSSQEQRSTFEELFSDAVKLRFRSDVPVGLTLSGGLDSSAILAASQKFQTTTFKCYTSVFSKTLRGEEQWAIKAAAYAKTSVESIEANLDNWQDTLTKIVQHMDSPGFSPAVFPLWAIMSHAKQSRVPVLLEGQGADELLAGYTQYPAIETISHLKAGHLSKFATNFQGMSQAFTLKWTLAWMARQSFPSLSRKITRDQRLKLFHSDILAVWKNQKEDPTLSTAGQKYDPLRTALWKDHAIDVLPALLHYGDSISMAHSIESRLPFMDYRIVEWVFRNTPPLLDNGETKIPVREFLRAHKFDEIADRKDKQGYPTPISQWFQTTGTQHFDALLSDKGALIWDIMNPDEVRKLANSAKNGSTRGIFHLYKIIMTDIWLRDIKSRSY